MNEGVDAYIDRYKSEENMGSLGHMGKEKSLLIRGRIE